MTYPTDPVIIVDDESFVADSIESILQSAGITHIRKYSDPRLLLPFLMSNQVSAILLDLNMPYLSGQELLEKIAVRFPEIPCIVVTGFNDIDKAVQCIQMGAVDYQVKPVEEARFVASVKRAIELHEIREENERLRTGFLDTHPDPHDAFQTIVTRHPEMLRLFKYVQAVANSPKPIMITGETGTGKELFARAAHLLSGRKGEFVALNIAGLDDTTFTDTLFGHVKGAYTGADKAREGAISRAQGGTILLDEIGDLKIDSQIKLLRLIQENEYHPLGSDIPRKADVRIIGCTNRCIDELFNSESIRRDFFYRMCTHHITIPPLRKRIQDIPVLLVHFFHQCAQDLGKPEIAVPENLIALLTNYTFPGNIRELEGMVYEALSKYQGGRLPLDSFIQHIEQFSETKPHTNDMEHLDELDAATWLKGVNPLPTLSQVTELLVRESLDRSKGNQSVAARLLGISRQALNKRVNNAEFQEFNVVATS